MSDQLYNVRLNVVVNTPYEESVIAVQNELAAMVPSLSFSPIREQPDLNECMEFAATGVVNQETKQIMIDTLDNDWEEADDAYWAYGFNTKMFNSEVYYLYMEFTPHKPLV